MCVMLTIKVRSKNRTVEQRVVKMQVFAQGFSIQRCLTHPSTESESETGTRLLAFQAATQYNLNMLIGCGNLVARQLKQSATSRRQLDSWEGWETESGAA